MVLLGVLVNALTLHLPRWLTSSVALLVGGTSVAVFALALLATTPITATRQPARTRGRPEPQLAVTKAPVRWFPAIAGLVLAITFGWIQVRYPYVVQTPGSLLVLLAAGAAATWLTHRIRGWRRTGQLPRDLSWAGASTIATLLLLLLVAQPPPRALHRVRCSFGTAGIGKGPVWIKVEPLPQSRGKSHTLSVRWGPHTTEVPEVLAGAMYFVLEKRDLRSPAAAVGVEPPAYLSCGNGTAPTDAPHRDLVGGWQDAAPHDNHTGLAKLPKADCGGLGEPGCRGGHSWSLARPRSSVATRRSLDGSLERPRSKGIAHRSIRSSRASTAAAANETIRACQDVCARLWRASPAFRWAPVRASRRSPAAVAFSK